MTKMLAHHSAQMCLQSVTYARDHLWRWIYLRFAKCVLFAEGLSVPPENEQTSVRNVTDDGLQLGARRCAKEVRGSALCFSFKRGLLNNLYTDLMILMCDVFLFFSILLTYFNWLLFYICLSFMNTKKIIFLIISNIFTTKF